MVALARLLKTRGDERSALVFLAAALDHPTCWNQTKEKIAPFASRLEAKFSAEEVRDAVQQAKLSRIEDLAATWLAHEKKGRKKPAKKGPKARPGAGLSVKKSKKTKR